MFLAFGVLSFGAFVCTLVVAALVAAEMETAHLPLDRQPRVVRRVVMLGLGAALVASAVAFYPLFADLFQPR